MLLQIVVLMGFAYVIGSIPTGIIIARVWGVRDIREHGSGTMGATNVARVLGKKFFVPIFLLDAGKAYGYLWLVQKYASAFLVYSPWIIIGVAGALLLGNGYSLFLRFGPSGKGVATSIGILTALCPNLLIAPLIMWLLVAWFTRRIGFASVVALVAVPVAAWCMAVSFPVLILTIFIACWGLWLHRSHVYALVGMTRK